MHFTNRFAIFCYQEITKEKRGAKRKKNAESNTTHHHQQLKLKKQNQTSFLLKETCKTYSQ